MVRLESPIQEKRPGRSRRQADLSPALEPPRVPGLRAQETTFLLYRRPEEQRYETIRSADRRRVRDGFKSE